MVSRNQSLIENPVPPTFKKRWRPRACGQENRILGPLPVTASLPTVDVAIDLRSYVGCQGIRVFLLRDDGIASNQGVMRAHTYCRAVRSFQRAHAFFEGNPQKFTDLLHTF